MLILINTSILDMVIGFDMKETFGFPAIGFARNVIIFEADMDSSVHIDNKNKKHSNLW